MTVMQFPSAENFDNDNSVPERTQLIHEQTIKASKKVLKVSESYKTVKSLYIRKAPPYAPSVAIDISQYLDNGQFIASEKLKGQSWLQKIADIDNIISWSKYHSDNAPNVSLRGNLLFFPLFQNQFIRCLSSTIAWKLSNKQLLT